MSPLSPLCYIIHDRKKSVGLVIVMILELLVYFGALIYTNSFENLKIDGSLAVFLAGNTVSETPSESFEEFKEKIKSDRRLDSFECNSFGSYSWNTVFNNVSSNILLEFSSVESFEKYCVKTGISCDTSALKDKSIIMSKMLAVNNGVKVGDTIDEKVFPKINSSYTFDLMTDEKGYSAYSINKNIDNEMIIIFPSDGKSFDMMKSIAEEYIGDLKSDVMFIEGMYENNTVSFFSLVILVFSLILYSAILLIMINAVFSGAYQTRSFEFALYKAVGIRKRKIVWKIISEIICIQLLALITGGIILYTFLYLFNNIVLYPQGKYICYYNPYAVMILAGVVLIVNVPLIISRAFQVVMVKIRNY